MAISVVDVVLWIVPWTLFVAREFAITPPAIWRVGTRVSRDQILEIGLNALVGGCLRIRDVAGYVLHGEGLRLQATDRSCKSVEQTHDFISAYETHFALSGLRTGCPVAITVPSNLM